MKKTYTLKNEEASLAWGEKLGETLTGGELILLSGLLGMGKTVIVRGIAKALEIKKITSPTFNLLRVYEGFLANKKGEKKKRIKINLYHFDCYRLTKYQELLDLGWKEIFENKANLVVLEWPECILDFKFNQEAFKSITAPKKIKKLELQPGKNTNERKLLVN